ncbi:MAG: hypothetical protein U0T82_07625 [Bacteroidales bacterium]
MKIIRIILIAIVIGSTVMPFMPVRLNAQTNITLYSKSPESTPDLLKASAAIISERIKDYTGKEPECEISPAEGKIKIQVKGEWSPELLVELAVRKGEMNIYEVIEASTVLSSLSADNSMAQKIRDEAAKGTGKPEILIVSPDETTSAIEALQAGNTRLPVLWTFGVPGPEGVSLYALKLEEGNSPIFQSPPVKEARAIHEKRSGMNRIEILFNEQAARIWADATERNINKFLAMVVDHTAICVPMVRASISGGRSAITGNFTLEELKFMEALLGNGVLPLELAVVK